MHNTTKVKIQFRIPDVLTGAIDGYFTLEQLVLGKHLEWVNSIRAEYDDPDFIISRYDPQKGHW